MLGCQTPGVRARAGFGSDYPSMHIAETEGTSWMVEIGVYRKFKDVSGLENDSGVLRLGPRW